MSARAGVLLSLYLAQGLPGGISGQALQAILREQRVSLTMIGYSSLLAAPWALKVLWSPLVDACYWPRLGRARSWVIPLQLMTALALLLLALLPSGTLQSASGLAVLFGLILLLNFCAATQDVATDGLAVRLLPPAARGLGNAIQVGGYRMGMVLGGGALLYLLGSLGWQSTFLLASGLMLLLTVPIVLFAEPASASVAQTGETLAGRRVFASLLQRPLFRHWLWVLATCKLAEGLGSAMVKPMLVDMGLSLQQIGLQISLGGSLATLVGAAMGAWLLRAGLYRALVLTTWLQALGLAGYGWLAWQWKTQGVPALVGIVAINAFDHWAGGLATVAVLTVVMDYCRQQHAGADFTLQVSIMTVGLGLASMLSGHVASRFGYANCYLISAALAVLLLWPVRAWGRSLPAFTHPASSH